MLWASIEPHDHFGLRNDKDIVFTSPAARLGGHSSQLSLWLYHLTPTAESRDLPPRRTPNTVDAAPAQRLELHYLITPLATDADKNLHLMEIILRTFAIQPTVTLEAAPAGAQTLRIVQRTESALERARIWQALRTEYQLSAAYDVSGLRLVDQ